MNPISGGFVVPLGTTNPPEMGFIAPREGFQKSSKSSNFKSGFSSIFFPSIFFFSTEICPAGKKKWTEKKKWTKNQNRKMDKTIGKKKMDKKFSPLKNAAKEKKKC